LQQLLFALRDNPEQRSRFFGVLSHSVPVQEFFAPENLQNIMRGLAQGVNAGTH